MTKKSKDKPPVVHPKLDLTDMGPQETVDFTSTCLATCEKSPLATELAAETAELKAANVALVATMAKEKALNDELQTVEQTRIGQTTTLKQAAANFGNKAAQKCNGDAVLLKTCNINAAQTRGPRGVTAVGQISRDDIKFPASGEEGSLPVKFPRLAGTSSVEIQYRLASAPATAPWLPEEPIATNALTWTITGFAHKEAVHVRIRAIGATRGEWSEYAIGFAK